MKDISAPIVYQNPLPGGYWRLGLKTGLSDFRPGQFAMLKVPQDEGVLLRRPFSLARQIGEITEILYKVVGVGTRNLSEAKVGARLDFLGPLGKGFREEVPENGVIGVAGGYGVAPFWELGNILKKQSIPLDLYYGARSEADLMYLQELKEEGVRVHVATQDGSRGFHGLVTELLERDFSQKIPKAIYSCGPMGMLKAVGRWAEKKKVYCELSVEEAMGCGTGVCLGCVVKDTQGHFLRSCREGPVFDSRQLDLNGT